jgi:hypothetical protein
MKAMRIRKHDVKSSRKKTPITTPIDKKKKNEKTLEKVFILPKNLIKYQIPYKSCSNTNCKKKGDRHHSFGENVIMQYALD